MRDATRKLLLDAFESCCAIESWVVGKSYEDYDADRQLRRAVEREFEIVGEAVNRLRRTEPETAQRIRNLSRIVAFRNIVIHGYDTVDNAAVWGIIETKLQEFKDDLRSLLNEPEQGA